MSLRLFFLTAFLFLPYLNAMTLEDAVYQTLHTSPEIKDGTYSLDTMQKEREIVESSYYPKLDIFVGTGLANDNVSTLPSADTGNTFTRLNYSAVASINVFNGFGTRYDVESQKHRTNAAKSSLSNDKTSLTIEVVEAYTNMLKQKEVVYISKENVASHQKIYDKLTEYVNSGLGKASDLKFASGRLSLAQINMVVNENNFIQSKIIFETTLGAPIDVNALEEPIFDYVLPISLEVALATSLQNNPSIQLSKDNIKSAQSNYKRSKSVKYPTIDIELKKSWLSEKDTINYNVDGSHAMVYLNYNLFNGFADKAKIEQEHSIYMQNNQYLLLSKRDVARKLSVAWITSLKVDEQLKLLKKMQIESKKTLEDYHKEFLFGRRTLLDIIVIENDYNNARQSYVIAKYDLLLSRFRILDAMGGLVDYFLAKAEDMQLIHDENYVEDNSVYNIVKQINNTLEANEDFISYHDNNNSSLDNLIEKSSDEENSTSLEDFSDEASSTFSEYFSDDDNSSSVANKD